MIRDNGWLEDIFDDGRAVKYWRRIFDAVYEEDIDSWAYAWTFACWIQSGLTILPNVNLVSNIGFGEDATHTKGDRFANMAVHPMDFPLQHPAFVLRDAKADHFTQSTHFDNAGTVSRVKRRAKALLKRLAAA